MPTIDEDVTERDADETRGGRAAETVIPVVEEVVNLSKRPVQTGRVVVRKAVDVKNVEFDEPVEKSTVEVRRVERNMPVDEIPQVRVEGDTTIIPVVEEIVEVRKRLVLKEEVYVSRKTVQSRESVRTEVRSERVDVERRADVDSALSGKEH